jgi:uncharacterized protein
MNSSQVPSIYNVQSEEMQAEIQRAFITRVYAWMTFGLLTTAVTAFIVASSQTLMMAILSNQVLFLGLLFAELALVIVISAAVTRLSPLAAGFLFTAYALLNGVTLSLIFLVYTHSSIAIVFGITACTFGIMTLFGFTTHRDLTRLGNLLIMALVGMVLASLVNLFFSSPAIYWITTYLGVVIFIGLIAYDTQKLKRLSLNVNYEDGTGQKASILGALSLYLDLINLFLLLLRIVGRRR